MTACIAIVANEVAGWHANQLLDAFARRGYSAVLLSLRDCSIDIAGSPSGISLPGFDGELPVAVLVRGVPGGTLEEIVLYLDVLHALRDLGVPVQNDARAIERAVDKGMTSWILNRAGVPTPPAWVVCDAARARQIVLRELAAGYEVVSKPLFGAQGVGLVRVANPDVLPEPESVNNAFYLQRYVEVSGIWHDWRVFVIGGRAVAAMRREGICWINNVAAGGRCHAVSLDEPLRQLSEQAVAALKLDHAGVDIIRDKSGRYWVIEVNSMPAWKGLQSVSDVPIADLLADCLVQDIARLAGAGVAI